MAIKIKKLNQNKERRTIVSVIVAAIAASICCVGPLVLLALGIGGAWIGNLTALEPFRPYLMGLTFIILGYAFYKIYRKPKLEECAPGSYCANPKSDRINKIALWISTVFVMLLLSVPYMIPLINGNQNNQKKQSEIDYSTLMVVTLDVPDMYCPACPFTVQKSLLQLDGVISAEVSLETKKAIVTFDRSLVTTAQMIEVTTNVGYPSVVIEN